MMILIDFFIFVKKKIEFPFKILTGLRQSHASACPQKSLLSILMCIVVRNLAS